MIENRWEDVGTINAGELRPGLAVECGRTPWEDGEETVKREVRQVIWYVPEEVEVAFSDGVMRTFSRFFRLNRFEMTPIETTPASRTIERLQRNIDTETKEEQRFSARGDHDSALKAKHRRAGLKTAIKIIEQELAAETSVEQPGIG